MLIRPSGVEHEATKWKFHSGHHTVQFTSIVIAIVMQPPTRFSKVSKKGLNRARREREYGSCLMGRGQAKYKSSLYDRQNSVEKESIHRNLFAAGISASIHIIYH